MDRGAAELGFRYVFVGCWEINGLDDPSKLSKSRTHTMGNNRRSGSKQRTNVFAHDAKVRHGRLGGSETDSRTESSSNNRNFVEEFHHPFHLDRRRNVRVALFEDRSDGTTAGRAVEETNEGDSYFAGQLFGVLGLAPNGTVRVTSTNREIVSSDDNATPIDSSVSRNVVCAREADDLAVLMTTKDQNSVARNKLDFIRVTHVVVVALAGNRANFD